MCVHMCLDALVDYRQLSQSSDYLKKYKEGNKRITNTFILMITVIISHFYTYFQQQAFPGFVPFLIGGLSLPEGTSQFRI